MDTPPRDARRRRIIERGSDRLAFITGESRTLPTPPPLPSPSQRQPGPPVQQNNLQSERVAVASFSNDDVTIEPDDDIVPPQRSETSKELSEDETTEEFPKCKLGKEFPRRGGSCDPPATNAQTTDESTELLNTSVIREASDQFSYAAPSTPQSSHPIFTPSQISRSISDTEYIRITCAVAIAVLVVLSYHGYPLGGRILGSLVSFSPLFLLLLTDATIVLGRVWAIEGGDDRNEDEGRRPRQEEKGLADDVGKALETGLVVQKALSAVFMDCSICAVIMISGVLV